MKKIKEQIALAINGLNKAEVCKEHFMAVNLLRKANVQIEMRERKDRVNATQRV